MKKKLSITNRNICSNTQYPLVNTIIDPYSWTTCGTAYTQTYNFNINILPGDRTRASDNAITGITPLGTQDQTYVRMAMDRWENVCNLRFQYNADNFQPNSIIAGASHIGTESDSAIGGTLPKLSDDSITLLKYADVYIYRNSTNLISLAPGSQGFGNGLLHELGHSFGLDHPFLVDYIPEKPVIPSNQNNIDITIMAYNSGRYAVGGNSYTPATPMLYDIQAAQTLYGANTGYMSGDTKYYYDTTDHIFKAQDGLNPTALLGKVMTLWDGGGKDTIDFSNISTDTRIDLREGIDQSSNKDGREILSPYVTSFNDYRIFLAYNSNIENAITGDGNDSLYSNKLNNLLKGNKGTDTYYFEPNHGHDIIDDSDGKGEIIYGGVALAGVNTAVTLTSFQ